MAVVVVGAHPAILPQARTGAAVEIRCLRHGESENVRAGASGVLPHAPLTALGRQQAADRRVADGETGHDVLARMAAALTRIATDGGTPALVGHVAGLTLAISVLCGLGGAVWGAPLPHAVPFSIRWDGSRWHCPRRPA
jgi:broad specificity phosphatase PhoE